MKNAMLRKANPKEMRITLVRPAITGCYKSCSKDENSHEKYETGSSSSAVDNYPSGAEYWLELTNRRLSTLPHLRPVFD